VITPHLSRRGPNGLWLISRGDNHPLEQAFRAVAVYYLRGARCPDFVNELDGWRRIYSFALFTSRREAKEQAAEEKKELGIDRKIATATGSDLLRLIATADVVEIGEWRLPISVEGSNFDEAEQLTTSDELLAILTNRSGR
jgi:hypothetical protein